MSEWKTIDSAPKDRKAHLVFCPDNKCIFCVSFDRYSGTWGYFGGGGTLGYDPTHWMPLPDAPEEA